MASLTLVSIIDGPVVISVDAVLREQHRLDSTVTQFPVEDGATISDHIYDQPVVIVLDGFVSTDAIEGYDPDAVSRTLRALEQMRENKQAVRLWTNLKNYDGMVLTSLQIDRDLQNGRRAASTVTDPNGTTYNFSGSDSMRFTAQFTEIKTVQSQTVTVAPAPKPGRVAQQATPKKDGGQQAVQPVTQEEVKKSLAVMVKEGLTEVLSKMGGVK